MSRSPSPASDVPPPAPHDENDDKNSTSSTGSVAEPSQNAIEQSREDSAAPSLDADADDASPSSSAVVAESSASGAGAAAHTPDTGAWQAVWSPAHSAYYFYNALTHETTWSNPLQPTADAEANAEAGPSSVPDGSSASPEPVAGPSSLSGAGGYDIYAAAAAQGIDPALAHLDPSLLASSSSAAGAGAGPGVYAHTAKFNARTGAFTRADGRAPEHLSEYERARRMSAFYFDVDAWERDVEARKLQEAQDEADGKKRKRPSKKDLDRFKEQKRQKKLAKTAWLRT